MLRVARAVLVFAVARSLQAVHATIVGSPIGVLLFIDDANSKPETDGRITERVVTAVRKLAFSRAARGSARFSRRGSIREFRPANVVFRLGRYTGIKDSLKEC